MVEIQAMKEDFINRNLISLKTVLFIFFGGLGCLYPFLPLHMLATGLNHEESRIISIVAPLFSVFGPLIVGPLADKMAGKKYALSGKYLRVITVICMVLAALFYSLLLAIPSVERFEARRPLVSFGCESDGATIFQERCTEEKTCFHWKREKMGSLILTNCSYTCQNPSQFESLYQPWTKGSAPTPTETSSESAVDYDEDYGDHTPPTDRRRRHIQAPKVEPPHLCIKDVNDNIEKCHVFTDDTKSLTVQATLRSATNQENETHSAEWCNYPLDGFQCHLPPEQAEWMTTVRNETSCKPMVECEVYDPYDSPGSVLAESQCIKVNGDVDLTFWSYLAVRSLADIFPTAIVTLLDTIIIIATRETSTGRGDVGRQLAFGSLGWAIFAPIIGAIGQPVESAPYLIAIIVFVVMTLIAAVILLLADNMPLSPPEWWWQTKSGMLAIPMSAIRKYGPETAALTFVAMVLGIFWSTIDSYQPWHILELFKQNMPDSDIVVGLGLTVAALPALLLLWNAETLVDYCGHSNVLIASFTVYILRYTGLAIVDCPWWTLLMEAMEPVTLGLTWVTLVLYMRYLMPRRLTGTGQALPVLAHFCLGKSFGAMIGLVKTGNTLESLRSIYTGMAIAAVVMAVSYFLLYHGLLAPRCVPGSQPPPPASLLHTNGQGALNGNGANGNYTPLRVYHNSRAPKGHFRY